MNSRQKMSKRRGFSLIELVIVVVIIAIIGAIAIPKMSRAATGAGESALTDDLNVLRNAQDLYNIEHPNAQLNTLAVGTGTTPNITSALTQYSDVNCTQTSPTKGGAYIYGPYIRGGVLPTLPLGKMKGNNAITGTAPGASVSGSAGWYFDGTTFYANTDSTEVDSSGKAYNTY